MLVKGATGGNMAPGHQQAQWTHIKTKYGASVKPSLMRLNHTVMNWNDISFAASHQDEKVQVLNTRPAKDLLLLAVRKLTKD